MEYDPAATALHDGPDTANKVVILAHGAGVGYDTPFMDAIATGLAKQKLKVVRFEFPYMAKKRVTGKRSGPDKPEVLQATWTAMTEQFAGKKRILAGKSMGGRIASLIADQTGAAGLICLGYPFHPPGKPEKLRTEHLAQIETPTLILQGTRDPFGTEQEVAGYTLSASIQVHWLADGEHSFKPRKKSGRSEEENIQEAIVAMVEFISGL